MVMMPVDEGSGDGGDGGDGGSGDGGGEVSGIGGGRDVVNLDEGTPNDEGGMLQLSNTRLGEVDMDDIILTLINDIPETRFVLRDSGGQLIAFENEQYVPKK